MRVIMMIALLSCLPCLEQAADACKPSTLNIPSAPYSRVHPDHRATFRVVAPDANKGQIRVGQTFDMVMGSDGAWTLNHNAASIWWVNGKEVIGIYGDRQTVIHDGVSKHITLKKGPNIVPGAVANGGGATDFCARFLDKYDAPVKTITVNLGQADKQGISFKGDQ
jgi:hypothetical protein